MGVAVVRQDFPKEGQCELDLEGQGRRSFPDRIMVAAGKAQKGWGRNILGRRERPRSLQRRR